MNNRKGNARRNQSSRYQKAFYFVDNLHENVLRNVYSLDLNYNMELKIQGRFHSGKTEDNRANTSEVEVGRLVQSVRQQSLQVFKIFKPWTLIDLLGGSETPAGHFSH